jgi:peptidyl-prolyl cis-trans isomerase D
MALIGEIRKRSWILIVFIGLGMGGFLLMDMIGQNSNGFGNSNTVGEIAGKEISITDFQRRQEQLYGGSQSTQFQIREGLWQYYVRESILQTEAEALGLSVSDDEFNELAYGPNPQNLSPIIRQAFGNQQTGQIDMAQLNGIKQRVESNQMTPEEAAYWNTLTEQIRLDRLESKIMSIASHAIYTPTWMAEMEHNATNRKADFRFVQIPYSTVKDEEVTVSDKELKNYISENKGQFMIDEETRKFDYILFDVKPTAKDSADIAQSLSDLVSELTTTEDDSSYIANSLGGVYQEVYELKDRLSPQIQDTVSQIPVGTVFGPYVDGSKYKLAKLVDKQIVPDSVKARHILRSVSREQTQEAYFAAMRAEIATVDSLIVELNENRANFDSLSVNYGMDYTRNQGGNLGIFSQGQQPKELSDLAFFKAKTGEYNRVITQSGVHILQVQRKYESGKMGYLVGYLTESIIPSPDTEKTLQREAAKFAATLKGLEDFTAKAEKAGYTIQTTTIGTRQNDYRVNGIGEGESAREIIKWGYDADKGNASNEVYIFESTGEDIYVDKYAVVALRSVAEKGLASLNDDATRLRAENAVKNEKKADIIKKKIEKGQSLDAIATAFGSEVKTASQVSTKTANIPGMGSEAKIAGAVFNMKVNQVSAPIAGNTGVYVIEPTFIPEPSTPGDLPAAKQQASAVVKAQVGQRLIESLRKQTAISDSRYRFF